MINEEGLRDWFGKSKSKDGKPGWVQSDGSPCANEPGETGTPKCYSSAKKASMSKKELRSADARKSRQDPGQQQKSGAAKPTYVSTDKPKKKMKEETFNEAEDKKTKGSGSKDACYSKVKSRYSVWPSAYASGALVKCRKVGASNWGNSTKKEEMEGFYDLPELTEMQIGALKYAGYEVEVIDEACWAGYEKKGMKTMFGKKYPNCVKKEEFIPEDEKTELQKKASRGDRFAMDKLKELRASGKIGKEDKATWGPGAKKDIPNMKKIMGIGEEVQQLQELERTKIQTGNMYQVIFGWRGKMMMVKLFFPDTAVPGRQKVAQALNKMYPGAQLRSYSHSIVDYDDPYINVGEETVPINTSESLDSGNYNKDVENRMKTQETSQQNRIHKKHRMSRMKQNKNLPSNASEHYDWRDEIQEDMTGMSQKSGDKRSTDSGAGMTAKGVAKYNRRTGGDLKTAVTTPPSKLKPGSKAAGRRKSFCARSRSWTGERGKAARRRWNC